MHSSRSFLKGNNNCTNLEWLPTAHPANGNALGTSYNNAGTTRGDFSGYLRYSKGESQPQR